MGRVLGSQEQGLTKRWAQNRIAAIFPQLGPVTCEEAWHGQIAMTPDHLPRVRQRAQGLWTAIGYNARGISTGTLLGVAMADLLTGMPPVELPLPITVMTKAPRAAFMIRDSLPTRFEKASDELKGGCARSANKR